MTEMICPAKKTRDRWCLALAILLAVLALLCAVAARAEPTTRPAPKFIVGVYYQPLGSLPKWKARGINTLYGIETEGGTVKPADYIKAAHAADFYVIGDDPAADAREAKPDEPNGGGNVRPDAMQAQYKADKLAAPNVPVVLNLDGWTTQWRPDADNIGYCQAGDWIAHDFYVINRADGPQAIPKLGDRLDKMRTWGGPSKRLLAFIECGYQHLDQQDWLKSNPALAALCRAPTPDEMEQEVRTCIAHGATGIIYFPHDAAGNKGNWNGFDNTPDDNAARMVKLNAELSPPQATPATSQPVDLLAGHRVTITVDGVTYTIQKAK